MKHRETEAEPRNAGGAAMIFGKKGRRRLSVRASVAALLAILLAGLTPDSARATFLYYWLNTSGPTLSASFRAHDSAVAAGMINASDVISPPGFVANTPTVAFSNLAANSALAVDPVTGTVLDSTNFITATNSIHTLQISAFHYFIPTMPTQPSGRGIWRVTHVVDGSPLLSLYFIGFTNAQAQIQVTCGLDRTFVLESSADLFHWTAVLTNQVVGGVCNVTDPQPATAPARFYRAQ